MALRFREFKGLYYNSTQEEVMTWFESKFDPEANSMWIASFTDNIPSVGFVRDNKITGYYQQFDNKLKGIMFGSGVYHNGKLTFAWIFGESDIPEKFRETSFYDSCQWKQCTNLELWEHFYPSQEDPEHYVCT